MHLVKNTFLGAVVLCLFSLAAQSQIVQPMRYDNYSFTKQVNIGSGTARITAPSAYLEIGPRSGATKGMLPPVCTTAEMLAISSPAPWLTILNSDSAGYCVYNPNTSAWNKLTGVGSIYNFPSSVKEADGAVTLDNDTTAFANSFYGTNAAGRRGYIPQSSLPFINQSILDDTAAAIRADFPAGSSTDTTSLSNRINLKADKSTTLTINGTAQDLSTNRTWTIPTIISFAKNTTRDSIVLILSDGTRLAAKDSTGSSGGVTGSGTSGQLALWNGTSTVTGMAQYTYSTNTTYPGLTIGSSGGVSSSLSLRDAAGTYMALSSDGGYFGIYGSSTYKNVQIYSHPGGSTIAQFYRPTSYNLISLNGLVRSNDLTVLSNFEGNFHIPRTVPYQVSGNNYHGFTDGTDFRQGSSAFNSFGSFVKIGNNRTSQDHYAAFQNVWTKDSSNTISKIYGFANAVSEIKAGTITDLYGYYHYSPTVTGGTIDNHYGIYIPEVTGATKNVGAYIESNVGIGTSSPNSKLEVSGSFATKYTATATGITLNATHCVVNVTATGQTITLPTASGITGRQYTIKLTASGSCTVDGNGSETIDGATTYSLASQYKYVTIVSDGSNWIITANN